MDGPFQVLVARKLQKLKGNYLSVSLCTLIANKSISNNYTTGLKITAGHRTMSGQISYLTGQIFYSPVILTSHIQQSHRNKRKVPRSSVVCDELK